MGSISTNSLIVSALGILALLGAFYTFGLSAVLFLLLPLLAFTLAVWFPGAYPDYGKTWDVALRDAWRRQALRISLSLGVVYTLAFGVLVWDYLSWPNRGFFGAVLQAPLLMGMIYQCQYLIFVWGKKRLPANVGSMRTVAVIVGGLLSVVLILLQVEGASVSFEHRQQPFVDMLTGAPDRCDAFRRYLAKTPPRNAFETPDLYHGAVENSYSGEPQFVLAYLAKSDMEGMIVFYHSGSRKWITTKRNNRDGMGGLHETIAPLARCDGPGQPIVQPRNI